MIAVIAFALFVGFITGALTVAALNAAARPSSLPKRGVR